MVPCLNRQAVQIQDVIASPFYTCCITTSFYFGFPVERRVSTASEYVNVEGILDIFFVFVRPCAILPASWPSHVYPGFYLI